MYAVCPYHYVFLFLLNLINFYVSQQLRSSTLYLIELLFYNLELQVAIFAVLAMVVRRKPDVLISLFPVMRESSKYQGQDKLPLTVWLITQVMLF